MVRLFVRRSRDVSYLVADAARELDGVRDGGPLWWPRAADASTPPERALTTTARSNVVGYDLVIAAPRTISVLVALDAVHAPEVVAAHRDAVGAAIDYLEERALVVRHRAHGRDDLERGRWESVAAFTHGVNRHGEPHLHDHVLVGARPASQPRVLDARSLVAHLAAADALYRSSLRHEVARRTPWRPWRSFRGVEQVAGLDEGYRVLWGGHHAQRGEKVTAARAEVVAAWGRDRERFEPMGAVAAPPASSSLAEHAFAGALEGRREVARRHVVAAWSDAAVFGQSAPDVARSLDLLYPGLTRGGGVREAVVGVDRARMTTLVRERGPRPLDHGDLGRWAQPGLDVARAGRSR